ncbi:MAG: hypothetical protein HY286_08605 [Planctomycetes bacterium]|nr:hypothetical protein [Planctomycetota bacterium]
MTLGIVKSCSIGILGCFGGCLLFIVGIALFLGVFLTASVDIARDVAAGSRRHDGVQLSLSTQAPPNAMNLIIREIQQNPRDEWLTRRTAVWHDRESAIITLTSDFDGRDRGDAARAVRDAIDAIEKRGEWPQGAVRLRHR